MKSSELLGTLRFWQSLGQTYAEMFRGSLTASGIVTVAASWLGMGKTGAVILGICSIGFWLCLAIVLGYLVHRYRIIHATTRHEVEASEFQRRSVAALERLVTLAELKVKNRRM